MLFVLSLASMVERGGGRVAGRRRKIEEKKLKEATTRVSRNLLGFANRWIRRRRRRRMPLSKYLIRNEYSLADPELYRSADKDDPEALLEAIAMSGLVGLLRQLGDLAESVPFSSSFLSLLSSLISWFWFVASLSHSTRSLIAFSWMNECLVWERKGDKMKLT